MINILLDFLKGIAMGIANVIPGFSGGTMAVILKIYGRIINALNDFVKHPFKAIKQVWAILLGLITGIILAVFTIILALNTYPLQTILFFVGLIIGSIPMIYKSTLDSKKDDERLIKVVDVIAFIVAILSVVIMPILNVNTNVTEVNFLTLIIILFMGIISAGAMIIPGISGSLVLMICGYYMLVIGNIKDFLSNLVIFNFNGMGQNFLILIFFAIGALIGILLMSKLIKLLFDKYPKTVYIAILGLLLGSIFSIIYKTIKDYYTIIKFDSPFTYIVGALLLFIGVFSALFLYLYDAKHMKEEEKNTKNI